MSQELPVDEVLGVVDDHHHDSLGHQVAGSLGNDAHVRVDQVAYRLYLPLELGVHAAGGLGIGALQVTVN